MGTRRLIAAAALLLLAGCGERIVYLSDYCLHADPIRANREAWEAANDRFRNELTAHNEKGVELGCWAAPKPKVGH